MTSTRDPSIAELLSDLSEQTSRLVRDEMRLAQKELAQSAKHAGAGAGLFGAAGVLALSGFAVVIVAAVAALALVLPLWASALIVAGVLLVAAGVAVLIGKAQTRRVAPPVVESVDSVKQDVEEVRNARDRNDTAPGPDAGIDELQADIAATREQLGETVSALGSKFDVRGRAEDKVAATKAKVVSGAHSLRENASVYPAVPAALAAGATALLVAVLLIRRRRSA